MKRFGLINGTIDEHPKGPYVRFSERKAMNWTKDKPKAKGWYWVKARRGSPIIKFFCWHETEHGYEPTTGPLSTDGYEWFCGPLPQPSNEVKA